MEQILQVIQHDSWFTAEGESEIGAFQLRWRTPLINPEEVPAYSNRLSMNWTYATKDSARLPTEAENQELETFEQQVCELWEHDAHAILTAVLSIAGRREWVFYTPCLKTCESRMVALLGSEERFPLSFTTEIDTAWGYLYEDLLMHIDWQPLQAGWEAELKRQIA